MMAVLTAINAFLSGEITVESAVILVTTISGAFGMFSARDNKVTDEERTRGR